MKRVLFGICIAAAALVGVAGCDQREAVKTAIVAYIEANGQEKASEFIDRLVADGRLGSANAEAIKAALPQGIEKVKEVINSIGESK